MDAAATVGFEVDKLFLEENAAIAGTASHVHVSASSQKQIPAASMIPRPVLGFRLVGKFTCSEEECRRKLIGTKNIMLQY